MAGAPRRLVCDLPDQGSPAPFLSPAPCRAPFNAKVSLLAVAAERGRRRAARAPR